MESVARKQRAPGLGRDGNDLAREKTIFLGLSSPLDFYRLQKKKDESSFVDS